MSTNPNTPRETCSYVDPEGKACRQVTGLLPTVGGSLRCAWHDPARASERHLKQRRSEDLPPEPKWTPEDLPVREIVTIADAEKLSAWAAIQTALGKLDPREAMAVAGLCREFRMAHADAHLAGRMEELERRIKAAAAKGVVV